MRMASYESIHSRPNRFSVRYITGGGSHCVTFEIQAFQSDLDSSAITEKTWYIKLGDLERLEQQLRDAADQARAIREQYNATLLPAGV